ncbi:RDD family protein [Cystobacter fuscus DSM 2262]|uniref:RDD family protein n=1 Tax=Cystobacter fuscus (strain ATCC 25194 / DSM 2262 / NBRC 100088 / M29) TaxID=1242864 RepID=S9PKQ3_CYSF2|nr:RDD family protein [Cystobacter fuscus]EPX64840.1 RDD family protein [Cystobacter fuscus DSM 2262]
MSEPEISAPQRPGAFCALHAEQRAVTLCNRCGNYACEQCFQVAHDRQDYCTTCLPLIRPPLADRGARFVAVLVDQLALVAPILACSFLGILLSGGGVESSLLVIGLGLLGSLGVAGYQLYLLATVGQSLGKRMMHIKVVRTDGGPVDLARLIFLRNVVPALIGMCTWNVFSLVDTLCIFTEQRRCLHDHIADTQVVVVNNTDD